MKSKYRKLGEFIQAVDIRNTDLSVSHLLGVSIEKKFIESIANTIGTDLSKYKVIHKNEFACSLMQVSRDEKLPVACLKSTEVAIISPAYHIFKIRDEKQILPDYLEMWFKRTEFDREASYIAVGGVRGSMPWEDFIEMKLPVPALSEQQKIVNAYNSIEQRIQIKRKINEKLICITQLYYDKSFPINKQKTWKQEKLENISSKIICGKTPSTSNMNFWGTEIPFITIPDMHNNIFLLKTERYLSLRGKESQLAQTLPKDSICVSCIATVGLVALTTQETQTNQQINSIICKEECYLYFLYEWLNRKKRFLKQLGAGGSTTLNVSKSLFSNIEIIMPPIDLIKEYHKNVKPFFEYIKNNEREIQSLQKLQQFLIARITEGK